MDSVDTLCKELKEMIAKQNALIQQHFLRV
jgi:hypothetical protein